MSVQAQQDSHEEQERLGVLKPGMDDFWAQRLESASRFGYNFANIPVYAPDKLPPAPVQPQVAPVQAKSVRGQTGDKVTKLSDRAARQSAQMPAPTEQRPNQTGLPDALKSGVEQLASLSLDDVKVHYNSDKPAQLDALAYAQGSDIHVAPGQERHLPHEAWHVVQQAQGRVKPRLQMKNGVTANDDHGLEREADEMGSIALKATRSGGEIARSPRPSAASAVVQRFVVPGGGTKKNPLYYSSLDPEKRTFANYDEADAYDRQLEQRQRPQQPQPQVAQQPQPQPAPVVANPQQVARTVDRAAPNAVAAEPPVAGVAPGQAEPAAAPRNFPLGFASEKEFRDATRPLARRYRDAEIVITGSSVTGRSGDGTRAFRPAGTPKVPGVKKSGPSDIDIGVVKPGSVGQGQVDRRGFPVRNTALGRFEKKFGKGIKKATGGHPSGIKFFEDYPEEPRRGRSRTRTERPRIVREHTPVGQRQDEDAR